MQTRCIPNCEYLQNTDRYQALVNLCLPLMAGECSVTPYDLKALEVCSGVLYVTKALNLTLASAS